MSLLLCANHQPLPVTTLLCRPRVPQGDGGREQEERQIQAHEGAQAAGQQARLQEQVTQGEKLEQGPPAVGGTCCLTALASRSQGRVPAGGGLAPSAPLASPPRSLPRHLALPPQGASSPLPAAGEAGFPLRGLANRAGSKWIRFSEALPCRASVLLTEKQAEEFGVCGKTCTNCPPFPFSRSYCDSSVCLHPLPGGIWLSLPLVPFLPHF